MGRTVEMGVEAHELTLMVHGGSFAKAKLFALGVAAEVNDELRLAEDYERLSPDHVRFHFYVPHVSAGQD